MNGIDALEREVEQAMNGAVEVLVVGETPDEAGRFLCVSLVDGERFRLSVDAIKQYLATGVVVARIAP